MQPWDLMVIRNTMLQHSKKSVTEQQSLQQEVIFIRKDLMLKLTVIPVVFVSRIVTGL